jgi:hypothetical protein
VHDSSKGAHFRISVLAAEGSVGTPQPEHALVRFTGREGSVASAAPETLSPACSLGGSDTDDSSPSGTGEERWGPITAGPFLRSVLSPSISSSADPEAGVVPLASRDLGQGVVVLPRLHDGRIGALPHAEMLMTEVRVKQRLTSLIAVCGCGQGYKLTGSYIVGLHVSFRQ